MSSSLAMYCVLSENSFAAADNDRGRPRQAAGRHVAERVPLENRQMQRVQGAGWSPKARRCRPAGEGDDAVVVREAKPDNYTVLARSLPWQMSQRRRFGWPADTPRRRGGAHNAPMNSGGAAGTYPSMPLPAAARLKIGLSACFSHADPDRSLFTNKTLQYVEQSICHWLMSAGAMVV